MTLNELQEIVLSKKGEHNLLQSQLLLKKTEQDKIKSSYEAHIKAKWLLSEAQIRTQAQFKNVLESLVTKAILSIYPRDFTFILEFLRIRNKLECVPMLKEGNIIYEDIKDCQGGGLVDIISLAMRICLWYLNKPRSINTLILDEPLRFLGNYTEKAGQMIQEISHRLQIQMIIITHDNRLAQIADKAFFVTHNGIHSIVKTTEEE